MREGPGLALAYLGVNRGDELGVVLLVDLVVHDEEHEAVEQVHGLLLELVYEPTRLNKIQT